MEVDGKQKQGRFAQGQQPAESTLFWENPSLRLSTDEAKLVVHVVLQAEEKQVPRPVKSSQ